MAAVGPTTSYVFEANNLKIKAELYDDNNRLVQLTEDQWKDTVGPLVEGMAKKYKDDYLAGKNVTVLSGDSGTQVKVDGSDAKVPKIVTTIWPDIQRLIPSKQEMDDGEDSDDNGAAGAVANLRRSDDLDSRVADFDDLDGVRSDWDSADDEAPRSGPLIRGAPLLEVRDSQEGLTQLDADVTGRRVRPGDAPTTPQSDQGVVDRVMRAVEAWIEGVTSRFRNS
jgi:hypothetical protein